MVIDHCLFCKVHHWFNPLFCSMKMMRSWGWIILYCMDEGVAWIYLWEKGWSLTDYCTSVRDRTIAGLTAKSLSSFSSCHKEFYIGIKLQKPFINPNFSIYTRKKELQENDLVIKLIIITSLISLTNYIYVTSFIGFNHFVGCTGRRWAPRHVRTLHLNKSRCGEQMPFECPSIFSLLVYVLIFMFM